MVCSFLISGEADVSLLQVYYVRQPRVQVFSGLSQCPVIDLYHHFTWQHDGQMPVQLCLFSL